MLANAITTVRNSRRFSMDNEAKDRAIFKGKLLLGGMAILLVYALAKLVGG